MTNDMSRKPPAYFFVILPIFVIGGISLVLVLIFAYSRTANMPVSNLPNLNSLLISLPAFFLWIPVSLLLGNLLLYWIAPLRRIVERYVSETNRPGFVESQKALLKLLLFLHLFAFY